jgi:hypothetical protein
MIEAGVPDFESALWFGLVAPAGTPQPVIDKLSRAANEALKSEDVIKSFTAKTMAAIGGTPEDFGRYIAAEERGRPRQECRPKETIILSSSRPRFDRKGKRARPFLRPAFNGGGSSAGAAAAREPGRRPCGGS